MEQQQSYESDIVSPQDLDFILTSMLPNDIPVVEYVESMPQRNELEYHEVCHSTQVQPFHGSDSISSTGNVPSTEEFPGIYDFKIKLTNNPSRTSWMYSTVLKKVFIDMEKILLVQFYMNSFPPGMLIRALPVYSATDYVGIPVARCAVHAMEDDPNSQAHSQEGDCYCTDYKMAGHVLRVESSDAFYCYDKLSERHSVIVPAVAPQPGSGFIEVPYKFKCKTSCPRGMQRRPINVIFTLETQSGEVVGRTILQVKICSCPKRDKEKQERDYLVVENPSFGKRPMSKLSQQITSVPQFYKKVKYELEVIPDWVEDSKDHSKDINKLMKTIERNGQSIEDLHNSNLELIKNFNALIKTLEMNGSKIEELQKSNIAALQKLEGITKYLNEK